MDGNSHLIRRRLSAVLCADVVGYSALMQRDERATHLAYKASVDDFILPLVQTHFGSIVKSTGDGFFAQFDSVVSAMECALDIQTNLSEFQKKNAVSPALQFRLGVSSGDVISEEKDIYGNDVNLAARLQEQAQPGTICITAGTYEQVHAKLAAQFEDMGRDHLQEQRRAHQGIWPVTPMERFPGQIKQPSRSSVVIRDASFQTILPGVSPPGPSGVSQWRRPDRHWATARSTCRRHRHRATSSAS